MEKSSLSSPKFQDIAHLEDQEDPAHTEDDEGALHEGEGRCDDKFQGRHHKLRRQSKGMCAESYSTLLIIKMNCKTVVHKCLAVEWKFVGIMDGPIYRRTYLRTDLLTDGPTYRRT